MDYSAELQMMKEVIEMEGFVYLVIGLVVVLIITGSLAYYVKSFVDVLFYYLCIDTDAWIYVHDHYDDRYKLYKSQVIAVGVRGVDDSYSFEIETAHKQYFVDITKHSMRYFRIPKVQVKRMIQHFEESCIEQSLERR